MSDSVQITANLRHPHGVRPLLHPAEDLPNKSEYNTNSWFFIGHFEAEGEVLNFLFHIFTAPTPDGGQVVASALAFTNETTGKHVAGVATDSVDKAEISSDTFHIMVPMGSMSGDLDQLQIKARIPEGSVDLAMKPVGHVLYNGGIGYFPMLGLNVHQYSIPSMDTTGTLSLGGRTYQINGTCWFDRQWQDLLLSADGKPLDGKWTWMDLILDNGDRISLWGSVDTAGIERSWVTILHPDGHQTVTSIEPLSAGQSDYWTSPKSGKRYPTRWTITIPAIDAKLEVIPHPREQELVPNPVIAYYEAASSVHGTYRGRETKGYCYVELVGQWN